MTVLITLTTLGIDTGPLFNLSSSPDGTTFTQFATGIAKLVLEGGYSATVPDGTTTIRVTSTGVCTNYENITISGLDCGLVATAVISTPATTTSTTTGSTRTMYTVGISDISAGDACSNYTDPGQRVSLFSTCDILVADCILYTHPFHDTIFTGYGYIFTECCGNFDVNSTSGAVIGASSIQC
jgi:hypothetical protein